MLIQVCIHRRTADRGEKTTERVLNTPTPLSDGRRGGEMKRKPETECNTAGDRQGAVGEEKRCMLGAVVSSERRFAVEGWGGPKGHWTCSFNPPVVFIPWAERSWQTELWRSTLKRKESLHQGKFINMQLWKRKEKCKTRAWGPVKLKQPI